LFSCAFISSVIFMVSRLTTPGALAGCAPPTIAAKSTVTAPLSRCAEGAEGAVLVSSIPAPPIDWSSGASVTCADAAPSPSPCGTVIGTILGAVPGVYPRAFSERKP
jgi:hypothetical protein